MGWFKRLCLFVFGLAGLAALVALCLPWVGPYQSQVRDLIYTDWFFYAVEGCVCVTGLGCAICLLRSLFSPRNPKSVIISKLDGGTITVTRAAIASQTEHIVEEDDALTASSVRVRAKKRGHIRVTVKVSPAHPIDVVTVGNDLHQKLTLGLAEICGDKLDDVSLEFTEAEAMEKPEEENPYTPPYVSRYAREPEPQTDALAETEAAELQTGITVPMSTFSLHEAEEAPAEAEDAEPVDEPVLPDAEEPAAQDETREE